MTKTSKRDDRIDFIRGLALLVIFIDHVPKNIFEPFTLHSFAFCDAAEVFFFLSGYVASLVYGRAMLRDGFVTAAKKVWRRAGVIYLSQLGLMAAVLALVGLFIAATGDQTYRWVFRAQWVFENPIAYIWPTLTMHFQPGYLDILPTYVVLLAVFPLVLKGLERSLWLVVAPSFLLWVAVQVFGLKLWTTSGEPWFFNPFSWQFIFVLGAVIGHPAQKGQFSFAASRRVFWAALAIVVPVALIQMSETLSAHLWFITSLRPHTLLLDKTALGFLRLVSFFALAIVLIRFLPPIGALSNKPWAQAIIRCGSLSLQVFSFGVLLASVTAVSAVLSGGNAWVQSVLTIAGIAAQLAFAAWHMAKKREAVEAERRPSLLADIYPQPARSLRQ
ncbi:hypothetical protein FHS83_002051 [Rhizomicrobium palustre]|uniref:OpgC domain-containing protein n=1 Tax=Rhizomicrobium palustre TaxID=189966 RepID=A0A846MZJ6_9PROT|nr:OpgC domain-containing protein [Rhizomicrobium palustre]NIK88733.1 hypothetical protein [Rhizomicrobium palustre]